MRFCEADLGRFILDLLDDQKQPVEARFAGLRIDFRLDVVFSPIARFRRPLDGFRHGGQHHRLVNRFLARDCVRDL